MQERKVLLVEDNLGDVRLVQEMLAEAGNSLFKVYTADCLVAALQALARERFDVALVDLSLPDSHGLETLSTLQRHAPALPIVVLTGLASDSAALTAVEQGAQDYLAKGTLTSESLIRALRYAVLRRRHAPGPEEVQPAVVVGILGAKGGVGVTTIACHGAVALQRQSGKRALLVDLDTSAASASFLMKAQSEYTAAEASTNLHRLDASLWNSLVCATSYGVELLRSPGSAQFHDQLNGERVRHVLRFARMLYGYVVVDAGRLNAFSLNLIEEMSELLVVTTPELPSLYEAARVLKKLLNMGVASKRIHLVVNRSSVALSCSAGDIEKALGCPVAATFGEYAEEMHDAYAKGQFLDEKQQLRKLVGRLVARLQGEDTPPAAKAAEAGPFRFSLAGRIARAKDRIIHA